LTVASTNFGVCNQCRKRVAADHVVREGKVYLRKSCPDCGPTEALVSSDADRWRLKRQMCHFEEGAIPLHCSLQCETCGYQHNPRMVFLDVTNRCNMNCPICIANIPGMGFEFHPPLSYFEHILAELGRRDPKPLVQLFGGEPTVRDDIFQILDIARSNGLDARIVTNGLKLADEEYCKRICDYKVHVLLAFDGNDPAIYQRLRQNPGAHAKKLKALENLARFSRHKNTIMCCVARGINDQHMRGLIDFCHENRSSIKCLHFIPLTETWEEGEFETGISTTTEDVEQIIDDAFPEDPVEFIPAGLTEHLRKAAKFFGVLKLKFGGAHPNCESAGLLVSDGRRYWPLSHYLKMPLDEVAEQIVSRCESLDPLLSRLDPQKGLQRLRGRLAVLRAFAGLGLRAVDLRAVLKGNRLLAALKILGGMMVGKSLRTQIRKHGNAHDVMLMVVLPFEEYHSVESARLQNCWTGFVYEDPDSNEVKTIPVCMWGTYKNDLQRGIAEKYKRARAAVGRPA
jgi:uncharacterized radical SAM superfamily Fe-S cluster-containing enzyme